MNVAKTSVFCVDDEATCDALHACYGFAMCRLPVEVRSTPCFVFVTRSAFTAHTALTGHRERLFCSLQKSENFLHTILIFAHSFDFFGM